MRAATGKRRDLARGICLAITCAALVGGAPAPPACGQEPAPIQSLTASELPPADTVFPLSVAATAVEMALDYCTWSVKEEAGESNIDQFALPVLVQSRLHADLGFSYLFTVASSSLDFDGGGGDLSGITDGKLGLTYLLPDRRFSVGLGLRIPTGESELDPGEEAVARVLNDRILGFRVKRYGEGTDVEMRGAYATTLGARTAVAAAVSYLLKGDFTILDPSSGGESTYGPGDEFSVAGELSTRAGGRELNGRLRLATYGRDQLDGVDEIEEATEFEIGLGIVEEHLSGVAVLDASFMIKGNTRILSAEGISPVRDVGGNILRFGGGFYGLLDARNELGGRADLSLYGEGESGTGDGLVIAIGPRYRHDLGGGFAAGLGYTFSVGNAEDGTIDLTGHDLTATLGYGWGRR